MRNKRQKKNDVKELFITVKNNPRSSKPYHKYTFSF